MRCSCTLPSSTHGARYPPRHPGAATSTIRRMEPFFRQDGDHEPKRGCRSAYPDRTFEDGERSGVAWAVASGPDGAQARSGPGRCAGLTADRHDDRHFLTGGVA
jgi:hypothetical protein